MKTVTVSRGGGYLLLFSHMRAYTSLLGHIVGSHPEVSGYSEMHLRLRSHRELHQLALQVARRSRKNYQDRFVFDKLLHNHLDTRRKILQRGDVHPLVMVRRPQETLASILRLKARFIDELSVAEHYYVERLQRLREVVRWCGGECLFIEGEALIRQTDRVLALMTDYLQLSSPLDSHYETFQHTGKRRLGDSSGNIFAGKILQSSERSHDSAVVEEQQMGRSIDAYHEFLEFISREVAADKTVFA